jgi:hypothetical protein
VKKSQAFAALRAAVVAELQEEINDVLIPRFNAEIEQIRREFEEKKPESEALAMHRRRARISDLVIRRDEFISKSNTEMRAQLEKRISEYGGSISEIEIRSEDDEPRKVLEAKFDDGSVARMPKSLWINYGAFNRV